MATLTFMHTRFPGGYVEFDINDANWRMSQVRCYNYSGNTVKAYIYESGALIFTAVAPTGQMTSWNTTGIQLGWDDVDGGLMMGNYTFHVQAPGSA